METNKRPRTATRSCVKIRRAERDRQKMLNEQWQKQQSNKSNVSQCKSKDG